MKRVKLQHDPKTGDWYVLVRRLDESSRPRWEIESTHYFRKEAVARRIKILEEES